MQVLKIIGFVICIYLVQSQTAFADKKNHSMLSSSFIEMLRNSSEGADLIAHVEIQAIYLEASEEKERGYRIEVDVLERFKGPEVKTLDFFYTADLPDSKRALIGERMIVTLKGPDTDQLYKLPPDHLIFPDHLYLLDYLRHYSSLR